MINDEGEDSLIYKAELKTVNKTKTVTKAKIKTDHMISTRIKSAKPLREYKCKECQKYLRKSVALTTHTHIHTRKYLEDTEDYDINSSLNMREFYIT